MSRIFLIFGMGFLFLNSISGYGIAQTCTPPPSEMVSWWDGDGSASDIQGQNQGQLINGVTFGEGKVGQAFHFDGVDGMVLVNDSEDLDISGPLTIEAWVQVDQFRAPTPIVWKGNSFGQSVTTPYVFSVLQDGTLMGVISDGITTNHVIGQTVLPLGSLHHVAFVVTGTKLQLYLNGNLDAEAVQTIAPQVNSINLQIGSIEGAPQHTFDGIIDELSIYARGLSAGEINRIAQAGNHGKCKLNTPVGNNVVVEFTDESTEALLATLTFDTVTQAGNTSLTLSSTGPTPPAGFKPGNPPTYYDFNTTASFTDFVNVCIHYSNINFDDESKLQLMHDENVQWVNITLDSYPDTVNDIICGFTSSFSTFAVFEEENNAPIADAGSDLTITASGIGGSLVNLNGSGSVDPDGDTLTYSWSGSFGTASGVGPTINLPLGVHTITLTVDDGNGATDSDSVVITVQDTTPPVVTAPANILLDLDNDALEDALEDLGLDDDANIVPLSLVNLGNATATDAVGVVSITHDAPANFPLGTTVVTWSATDSSGNVGTATQTVTVVEEL